MVMSSTTWLVSMGLVGLGILIWAVTWWMRREKRPEPPRQPRQGAMDEFIQQKRRKGR